ncbi:hypothetical protein ACNQR7_30345 [Mycolicibacterium senegalense]|uniref:hypothetical protein n=1 Tax=Mycobacteriaceae TaxID=1762 RepID=UPI003AAB2EC6
MTTPAGATPTAAWQALVPELRELTTSPASDIAERLLLLLHYSIDWENSWVADKRYLKRYWDEILPGRVRRAAYLATTLNHWWSEVSTALEAPMPRYEDRRLELATLLGQPPLPVITELQDNLPGLILRVRIIADAVSQQRRATRR